VTCDENRSTGGRDCIGGGRVDVKGALQLPSKRYGLIHFDQVPEQVLTESFVVLIIRVSPSPM